MTFLIVQHPEQQQLNMGGKRHVQQHVQIENVEAKRQPAPLRLPVIVAGKVPSHVPSPGVVHQVPFPQSPEGAQHRRPQRSGIQVFR